MIEQLNIENRVSGEKKEREAQKNTRPRENCPNTSQAQVSGRQAGNSQQSLCKLSLHTFFCRKESMSRGSGG